MEGGFTLGILIVQWDNPTAIHTAFVFHHVKPVALVVEQKMDVGRASASPAVRWTSGPVLLVYFVALAAIIRNAVNTGKILVGAGAVIELGELSRCCTLYRLDAHDGLQKIKTAEGPAISISPENHVPAWSSPSQV